MSLEAEIKALAQAVIALTAKIEGINVTAPATVAPTPAPVVQAAPVVVSVVDTPAPVAAAPASCTRNASASCLRGPCSCCCPCGHWRTVH